MRYTQGMIEEKVKRAWGMCSTKINKDTGKPELVRFQFAAKLLSGDYSEEDIERTVKHELIHWYTDITQGKSCHHNHRWKENCRKFGIPDRRLGSYERVDGSSSDDYRWRYKCSNSKCGATYNRYRRIGKGYVCGICKGKLIEYPCR